MSFAEEVRATAKSPSIQGTRIFAILVRVSATVACPTTRIPRKFATTQASVSLSDNAKVESFNCRGPRRSNWTTGKLEGGF
jgi:hypothetical protein